MFVKYVLKISSILIGVTALAFTLSTCEEVPPFAVNLVCPNGTAAGGTANARGTIGCSACNPGYALAAGACVPADTPAVTSVTLPPSYVEGENGTVTVAADFENPQAMLGAGWSATGAFANPGDNVNAWRGRSVAGSGAAYVGDRPLNTCAIDGGNCLDPVATVTSPDIPIAARYLNFLVAGTPSNADIAVIIQRSTQSAADLAQNIATISPLHHMPRWIVSDYDWRTVDLQTAMTAGESIRIIIQDQTSEGWISVDHFFFSDTPWGMREAQWSLAFPDFFGGDVGIGNKYLRLHTGGFDPAAGLPSALFGGFDDASTLSINNGWVYSDNIMLDPDTGAPAAGGLGSGFVNNTIVDRAPGWVGTFPISTCGITPGGCEAARATITSAPFRVTGRYLNFLLVGGSGRVGAVPEVSIDGTEVDPAVEFRLFSADTVAINDPTQALLRMDPRACVPDFKVLFEGNDVRWHSIDVSAYQGEQLRFQLDDSSSDGCQSISLDHMYFSNTPVRGQGNIRATLSK